jgi:hypothetical protein
LAWFFVWAFMPETMGKSMEQIETSISKLNFHDKMRLHEHEHHDVENNKSLDL